MRRFSGVIIKCTPFFSPSVFLLHFSPHLMFTRLCVQLRNETKRNGGNFSQSSSHQMKTKQTKKKPGDPRIKVGRQWAQGFG